MSIIYATKLKGLHVIDSGGELPRPHALLLAKNIIVSKANDLSQYKHLLSAGQGNNGYIKGKVTEQSLPVVRRVMCYHRTSKSLVNVVWSDVSGNYFIDGLIAGSKYYVTSIDDNSDSTQYNAVTQDLITASEVI